MVDLEFAAHRFMTNGRFSIHLRTFIIILSVLDSFCQTELPDPNADPCSDVITIDEGVRHVLNRSRDDFCDQGSFRPSKWYRFAIDNQPAAIPTTCIQERACGTRIAMRIDLDNKELPREDGKIISVKLCGGYSVLDKYDCCVLHNPVFIARCSPNDLVYRFPFPIDRCPVAVCTQMVDSTVPSALLVKHGENAVSPLRQPPPSLLFAAPMIEHDAEEAIETATVWINRTSSTTHNATADGGSLFTTLVTPLNSTGRAINPTEASETSTLPFSGSSSDIASLWIPTQSQMNETLSQNESTSSSSSPLVTSSLEVPDSSMPVSLSTSSELPTTEMSPASSVSSSTDAVTSPMHIPSSPSSSSASTQSVQYYSSSTPRSSTPITSTAPEVNENGTSASTTLRQTAPTAEVDFTKINFSETSTTTPPSDPVATTARGDKGSPPVIVVNTKAPTNNPGLETTTTSSMSPSPSSSPSSIPPSISPSSYAPPAITTPPSTSSSPLPQTSSSYFSTVAFASTVPPTSLSFTSTSSSPIPPSSSSPAAYSSSSMVPATSSPPVTSPSSSLTSTATTFSSTAPPSSPSSVFSTFPSSRSSIPEEHSHSETSTNPTSTTHSTNATNSVPLSQTSTQPSLATTPSTTSSSFSPSSSYSAWSSSPQSSSSSEPSSTQQPLTQTSSSSPTSPPETTSPTLPTHQSSPSSSSSSSSLSPPSSTLSTTRLVSPPSRDGPSPLPNITLPESITTEKVRLAFKGQYGTGIYFESYVSGSLLAFLYERGNHCRQLDGRVNVTSTSVTWDSCNQSTIVDLKVLHNMDEVTLNVFHQCDLEGFLSSEANLTLLSYCRPSRRCGEGREGPGDRTEPKARSSPSVDDNVIVLITILCICGICLVVMVTGVLCARYRHRGTYKADSSQDIKNLRDNRVYFGGTQSPFTDQQIMNGEDERQESFSGSAVDGGTEMTEDTWVVPMEEISLNNVNEVCNGDGVVAKVTEDTQF